MCWIYAIKTNKSSENAEISLCCFIVPIILSPTELNLLQVIPGGASRTSCQMQVRQLTASLSTTPPTAPRVLAMTVLDFSSFFLNQLPYLRTGSIKHKGRYFSAAHCRGITPTMLSKYPLHFTSLILIVHSSAGIFLFQRANCSLSKDEGWKQDRAGWQLHDHKKFAMVLL